MRDIPSSKRLAIWFEKKVRPLLDNHVPEKVAEFHRELASLQKREQKLGKPLSVCFVGGSGVGKSTLINSLVAQDKTVVPSGGVGPMTALAIQIDYADQPAFSAIYHSPANFWKIGFVLENAIRREEKSQDVKSVKAKNSRDELADLLDDETKEELSGTEQSDGAENKTEVYRKQAQLIVTGDQDFEVDLKYLADCMREAIGQPRIWKTSLRPEDEARMQRLKTIFTTNDKKTEFAFELTNGSANFRQELRDHAAGYLSPIIKELEVRWNSEFLKHGVQLVDLPGIGISGDVYKEVASKWVRQNANAVVLVTNYRGINESDAHLLRSSGFLTRLLHSADDPGADPVRFIVAAVRADEPAKEAYNNDDSRSESEYLEEAMNKCRKIVSSQLGKFVTKAWAAEDGELSQSKADTIARLVESLQVYPMTPTEYRSFLKSKASVFLQSAEDSGVPALLTGLAEQAKEYQQSKNASFVEGLRSLTTRIISQIDLLKAQWQEQSRAHQEATALKTELENFIKPLREEFRARQGGFREFLKETLPANIDTVVSEASSIGTRSIRAYLRGLHGAHWKTLQAAVRKGGYFDGKRLIDLPGEFSLAFEDPVAEFWGKAILSELRKRTREFSEDCLGFVDKMTEWAKQQGGRVQPRLIEAQRDAIAADTKHLATVGKDAVNELRQVVKAELIKAIETPIRKKCKAFVDNNADVGRGVTDRIVQLFDELADDAIRVAKVPAKNVLLDNYRVVEKEIVEAWRNHTDPLNDVANAIVSSHEDSVKRSDAQKRARVLKEIEEVLGAAPAIEEL